MSTAAKVRTGQEVIEAMMAATTPSTKAKATKLQKEYVAQRVAEGKDAKKVLAGLLSRVNRLKNEQEKEKEKEKEKPAPKKTVQAKAAKTARKK
jgi:hypothetical protein